MILGTSFTAKDEDIIGADNDYKALEAALRNQINNIGALTVVTMNTVTTLMRSTTIPMSWRRI